MSQTVPIPHSTVCDTPLAAALATEDGAAPDGAMYRGANTRLRFAGNPREMQGLLHGAGISDLGYRTCVRVTGKDRVRWLNGMVTQSTRLMIPGQVAYTLVLNAQGRIQGDADVYCHEEVLLLETDRSQAERLLAHLRRFIIMDDVKLEELDASTTTIGIAGPKAAEVLSRLGAPAPEAGNFARLRIAGIDVMVAHDYGPVVPRFEVHVPADRVLALWNALVDAGVTPCGLEAMETLRVLEGVPLYDVDFSDKHLPQETNLQRALNFTKGCYIGQEIVERIRSRATVHRALRQFELRGETPRLVPGEKLELRAGGTAVGELTSTASIRLPDLTKDLALGVARVEALEQNEALEYDGGTAAPMTALPCV
jgi:folate-binding protein YgfZ